jgi:hypothetical protein
MRSHSVIAFTTAKRCTLRRMPRNKRQGHNKWLWGESSLASITQIITNGVPNRKNYRKGNA